MRWCWTGCERGVLDGVRVDHPDGLRDPLEYLKRLRKRAPDAWVVGEKILEPGEFLRESWPIQGTTGYDFLNTVAGVLVAPEGMAELNTVYGQFTGQPTEFPAIAREKKISVTQEGLGSDVNRLTSLLVEICESNRDQRDYTRAEMRRAIREVAACFPVYRTYVVPERDEITEEDRGYIAQATECAKQMRQDIDGGSVRLYARCVDDGGEGKEGERVSAAVSAVHRAGDGEGRGGYGVLLLQPADGNE